MIILASIITYTLFVLYVTLFPFAFKAVSIDTVILNAKNLLEFNINSVSKMDLFANIVLFGTLGILLGLLLYSSKYRNKEAIAFIFTGLYAVLLATFIEALQASSLKRVSSVLDIIVDSLSALAGFSLVVICEKSGLLKKINTNAKNTFNNNPVKFLWIILGLIILIGGLYPFHFSPQVSDIGKQIHKINLNSLIGNFKINTKFFITGIIYFIWGSLSVLASIKDKGTFAGQIFKKIFFSVFIVFFIEICQIFIPEHIPSRIDFEAAILWLGAGALITFCALARTDILKNRNSFILEQPKIPTLFWAVLFITILFLFLESFKPFIFSFESSSIKANIKKIEIIPFSSYINAFKITVIEDFAKKILIYTVLGAEFTYWVKKKTQEIRFIPFFSAIIILIIAMFVEGAQIFIPGRFPSSTDLLIALAGAIIGSNIWERFISKTKKE